MVVLLMLGSSKGLAKDFPNLLLDCMLVNASVTQVLVVDGFGPWSCVALVDHAAEAATEDEEEGEEHDPQDGQIVNLVLERFLVEVVGIPRLTVAPDNLGAVFNGITVDCDHE